MAKIGKARTEIGRQDPKFKNWIDNLARMKSFQENDRITPSRITEAIYNQYNKYPNLLDELKKTKLGRWKSK